MCGCSCSSTETRAETPANAVILSVPGMTCGHCASAITAAFGARLPGAQVEVDLSRKTVRVAAPVDIAKAILAEAGYEATLA